MMNSSCFDQIVGLILTEHSLIYFSCSVQLTWHFQIVKVNCFVIDKNITCLINKPLCGWFLWHLIIGFCNSWKKSNNYFLQRIEHLKLFFTRDEPIFLISFWELLFCFEHGKNFKSFQNQFVHKFFNWNLPNCFWDIC